MDPVYENNGKTTKEVMRGPKVWTILTKITENNKAKAIIRLKELCTQYTACLI